MIMLWLQRKNQKVDDQKEEINYVPDMIKVSLFGQIYKVIYEMSVHAESLVYKLTNNYAESFNGILAVEF